MKKTIALVLLVLYALPAFAADAPKTEEQKTLYAIGLVMARQLAVFNLTPGEFALVREGLTDGMTNANPVVDVNAYMQKVQELANVRREAQGEKLAAAGKEFLEKAAKEKGAVKTASGLIYLPLKEGEGPSPTATDKVKVNYRGTLTDGKEFDSSYKRGQPTEFPLSGVIPCWTEGLQLMKTGGKAKLICPSDIAYGKRGNAAIPPNATLSFEIELLEILKK